MANYGLLHVSRKVFEHGVGCAILAAVDTHIHSEAQSWYYYYYNGCSKCYAPGLTFHDDKHFATCLQIINRRNYRAKLSR